VLALERLTDDHLSANDRRIALMSTANSFQVEGDASSAALVANELTATDPCAMSGDAPSGESSSNDVYSSVTATRAMLNQTRSGARCVAYKPGAVFLRGLVIPGYGQYTSWSPLVGKMVAGATLAGATGSLLFHLQARSLYSTYQATLNGYGPQYYQKAVNAETNAKNVAIGTAAFWVAMAFEAEIQERVFAIRLTQAREFWIRPIVTSATASGPPVPALASGITFRFR
jgi:hypothetical protein